MAPHTFIAITDFTGTDLVRIETFGGAYRFAITIGARTFALVIA